MILMLTAADATALAQGIQAAVEPLAPALPASHPCCPQCQEPQHLTYATPLDRRHARGAGRHVPHLWGRLARCLHLQRLSPARRLSRDAVWP